MIPISYKTEVLKALEQNRGTNISGSEIAKNLGITRSAVWKAIQSLKMDGYIIQAGTNRGYYLAESNDILSEAGILPYLQSHSIGRNIKVYKSLPSTNQEAKLQAENGAIYGTVILADEQTNGRGRKGRSFYSPAGSGIYLSVILQPLPSIQDNLLITSAAAVAVANAIECVASVHAKIKWINDIFIDTKKVCGILTEAITDLESGEMRTIVLGIGINVSTIHFPDELSEIAAPITTNRISRNLLVAQICNQLETVYIELSTRSFLSEYRARSNILGKDIQVIKGDISYPAKAIEINDKAHLIVQLPDGKTEEISSGEISIKKI